MVGEIFTAKGMGTKASDKATLPMCDGHHEEQASRLGLGALPAEVRLRRPSRRGKYWAAWPGRVAWEWANG
jgi:hypothetical protein